MCVLVIVVVRTGATFVLRVAWNTSSSANHDSLEQVLRVTGNVTSTTSLPVMNAMPRLSLILGLGCLHALVLGHSSSIETTCDMRCIGKRLALAESPLVEQVVRCCDVVMSVRLDAFNSVVGIKSKLVKNLLIYAVLKGHDLLPRKQTGWLLVSKLAIPGVLSYLLYPVTLTRVRLQYF